MCVLSCAVYVCCAGYAFLLVPNRLGLRQDLAMVGRWFYDNALAFVLFNLLGLFPFITNCLMWPALRSKGGRVSIPVWSVRHEAAAERLRGRLGHMLCIASYS